MSLLPTLLDRALPLETASPAETFALGERIGAALLPGDLLAISGDLGAGKTHLVKGICAALGIDPEAVTSPTFTLVHVYEGRDFPLFHLDAYRLESLDAFYAIGYEDYFYGDGACLLEWPERVAEVVPPEAIRLHLTHLGGDRRRIEKGA